MYLRNAWYVAALPEELGNGPLGRVFLGESVVLYRGATGRATALEDRCCHRALPLSMGRVVEDRIQCGYHGLEFDAAGACVKVPGQARIPPAARVRRYPLVERYGWLWIWMGGEAGRAQSPGRRVQAFPAARGAAAGDRRGAGRKLPRPRQRGEGADPGACAAT